MSIFASFTAIQSKVVHVVERRQGNSKKRVFTKFRSLPAEIREAIYLFAIQPITTLDTASIPGTPDRVHIPAVAQASKQLRDEALYVLSRNRPIEVSLHCSENLRRARLWTERCSGLADSCGLIIFSGCLKVIGNQFYHITLQCSDNAPYFTVRTRPGAPSKADIVIAQIKKKLLHFLDRKVKEVKKDREGRLSSEMIAGMITLIDTASWGQPVAEPPTPQPSMN